jgi:hypothetical protein
MGDRQAEEDMKHRYQWLLSINLMLWPASVHALPDERDVYSVIGLGSAPCEYWTKAGKEGEDLGATLRGSWVIGFITAVNLFGPWSSNVTKSVDAKGLWAWIDNYCGQHPFDSIADAAEVLVSEFGGSAAPAPPQHGTSPVSRGNQ